MNGESGEEEDVENQLILRSESQKPRINATPPLPSKICMMCVYVCTQCILAFLPLESSSAWKAFAEEGHRHFWNAVEL